MPFINVKLIEGVFDAAQKREIVEKLTEAMVGIEGENMRPVTWCVVEEVAVLSASLPLVFRAARARPRSPLVAAAWGHRLHHRDQGSGG